MWIAFLIILGDQTAIEVAATCLVIITIGLVLAYLVKLLDKVKPSLGSRLSLIPIALMCMLIFSTFWAWINGNVLVDIPNLHSYEKYMLLSIPCILVVVIMLGWIAYNLDAIKGSTGE